MRCQKIEDKEQRVGGWEDEKLGRWEGERCALGVLHSRSTSFEEKNWIVLGLKPFFPV